MELEKDYESIEYSTRYEQDWLDILVRVRETYHIHSNTTTIDYEIDDDGEVKASEVTDETRADLNGKIKRCFTRRLGNPWESIMFAF